MVIIFIYFCTIIAHPQERSCRDVYLDKFPELLGGWIMSNTYWNGFCVVGLVYNRERPRPGTNPPGCQGGHPVEIYT